MMIRAIAKVTRNLLPGLAVLLGVFVLTGCDDDGTALIRVRGTFELFLQLKKLGVKVITGKEMDIRACSIKNSSCRYSFARSMVNTPLCMSFS